MEAFADIIFTFRGSSEWFAYRIRRGYFIFSHGVPLPNGSKAGSTSFDYISLHSTCTDTLLSLDRSVQTHDPDPARSK